MLLSRIQARSSNPALVRAAAIVLFAALTALGARIAIPLPFTPVPITLQVMIVLLAGLTLGAKDGALSQIVYVTTIAIGLPFDAQGIGMAVFASATAG
jgi:biotin transport system substrate-specific component